MARTPSNGSMSRLSATDMNLALFLSDRNAAIIRLEQLNRADKYVGRWERLVDRLTEGMSDLAG